MNCSFNQNACLVYCKQLLTNSVPKEEIKDDVEIKNILHQRRMDEVDEEETPELTFDMFNTALKELWNTKKEKYKFTIKGGDSLKSAIFHLFQIVWREEILPEGWMKTSLLQLYKSRGDFRELGNWRNIHLKEELPKMFGYVLVSKIKEKIMRNMSPFQIGAKREHRAQEHYL